jgi:hypothetical protein
MVAWQNQLHRATIKSFTMLFCCITFVVLGLNNPNVQQKILALVVQGG